jgi:Cu+-exporting ATPase
MRTLRDRLVGSAVLAIQAITMAMSVHRSAGDAQIYLEVATGVTVFLLAGRYFEARAKRRAGAVLRALLDIGARDVSVLRDGWETRVSVEALLVGDE